MTCVTRLQTKHLIDSQHLLVRCRSGLIQKRQYMLPIRHPSFVLLSDVSISTKTWVPKIRTKVFSFWYSHEHI